MGLAEGLVERDCLGQVAGRGVGFGQAAVHLQGHFRNEGRPLAIELAGGGQLDSTEVAARCLIEARRQFRQAGQDRQHVLRRGGRRRGEQLLRLDQPSESGQRNDPQLSRRRHQPVPRGVESRPIAGHLARFDLAAVQDLDEQLIGVGVAAVLQSELHARPAECVLGLRQCPPGGRLGPTGDVLSQRGLGPLLPGLSLGLLDQGRESLFIAVRQLGRRWTGPRVVRRDGLQKVDRGEPLPVLNRVDGERPLGLDPSRRVRELQQVFVELSEVRRATGLGGALLFEFAECPRRQKVGLRRTGIAGVAGRVLAEQLGRLLEVSCFDLNRSLHERELGSQRSLAISGRDLRGPLVRGSGCGPIATLGSESPLADESRQLLAVLSCLVGPCEQ